MRLAAVFVLLLPAIASAAPNTSKVRIECKEPCKVKLEGRYGHEANERLWLFDVSPGTHRIEATGVVGRPLYSGFLRVPDAEEVDVSLVGGRVVLKTRGDRASPDAGAAASTAAPAVTPAAPDAGVPMLATSMVRVRCPERCRVTVGRETGQRADSDVWEFASVQPGKVRIEVSGLVGRPLYNGFLDVEPGVELTVQVSPSGRLAVMGTEELGRGGAAPSSDAGR